MPATDPFGRAIRDHYRGTRTEPLVDRDGDHTQEHRIEEWYFGDHEEDAWRDQYLDGPLLDMGAGAGRDALYYQQQFETVAIEISDYLVETMRERGVHDARRGDMFDLRSQFDRERFQSAHAIGTQLGLAGSMAGIRAFLSDLAYVTTTDATAILDNYDPEREGVDEVLGYRSNPAPELATRCYHCEYEGNVGKTLLFQLCSPTRLRAATVGTPWELRDVMRTNLQWRAALEKRHNREE